MMVIASAKACWIQGILPISPPRANRKALEQPHYRRYKDRNRIERMLSPLAHSSAASPPVARRRCYSVSVARIDTATYLPLLLSSNQLIINLL
uniref:hypothetical protein n=1 Tax=Sphingopyxis fribergensis TaxID=1515612 RepID=UPI001E55E7B5|nr:hypothetical protein [Sphingopyxis fribergensis]